MKKLATKIILALAVLGFAGGTAFTPLAQTAAAEITASRVWVGQVNTYRERFTNKYGQIELDWWGMPQEVRCSHGYNLNLKSYSKIPLNEGYREQWFYTISTY